LTHPALHDHGATKGGDLMPVKGRGPHLAVYHSKLAAEARVSPRSMRYTSGVV
jgi:hypothetical protein